MFQLRVVRVRVYLYDHDKRKSLHPVQSQVKNNIVGRNDLRTLSKYIGRSFVSLLHLPPSSYIKSLENEIAELKRQLKSVRW